MKGSKSKILQRGYINIYSELSPQEKRQILYKTLYKKENPLWDETLVYLSNKFRGFLQPNLQVLDAGCGNGNYIIDENRKKISWAMGIDTSYEHVQKNICLDEIKIGNLESMPFKNNSFNVVISLWVLEHLKNPKKVFKEIHRVLKKDGVFMFATPYSKFLPLRAVQLINSSGVNHFFNRTIFGRKEQDIFKTYYKANTPKQIKNLSKGLFNISELRLNYDPSYTSFNLHLYKLSSLTKKVFNSLGITILDSHIVGVLTKTED